MNQYTRKDINVKTQLHGKKFITIEDAQQIMLELMERAVECGAEESKLMEFFSNEKD